MVFQLMSSSSFTKAIRLPQNVTAPISPESATEIETAGRRRCELGQRRSEMRLMQRGTGHQYRRNPAESVEQRHHLRHRGHPDLLRQQRADDRAQRKAADDPA